MIGVNTHVFDLVSKRIGTLDMRGDVSAIVNPPPCEGVKLFALDEQVLEFVVDVPDCASFCFLVVGTAVVDVNRYSLIGRVTNAFGNATASNQVYSSYAFFVSEFERANGLRFVKSGVPGNCAVAAVFLPAETAVNPPTLESNVTAAFSKDPAQLNTSVFNPNSFFVASFLGFSSSDPPTSAPLDNFSSAISVGVGGDPISLSVCYEHTGYAPSYDVGAWQSSAPGIHCLWSLAIKSTL